jgi:predicted phosphodiesterase
MKTVILSDTHLTFFFDKGKYQVMEEAISNADRVIINGDFWDGHLVKFNTFVRSRWNKIFPVLSERETIYLYGNHDEERFIDERYKLFASDLRRDYQFESGGRTFHVEHGHELYPLSPIMKLNLPDPVLRPIFQFGWLSSQIESAGAIMMKWDIYDKAIESKINKINTHVKSNIEIESDMIHVIGHSHIPEIDLDKNFANSGFMKGGLASYISIEDGDVELIQKTYKPQLTI